MKDVAIGLDDVLAQYNATIGTVPDVTDLPFQIVLPRALQQRMLEAVLQGRQSGKEAVAHRRPSSRRSGEWATHRRRRT